MAIKSYNILLLAASTTIAGCQTVTTAPSQDRLQHEPINTMQTEIPDSDGDGVLDDVDTCPKTPLHRVVDQQGCIVIIEGGTALEMSFVGFFASMSSQLPNSYAREFAQIEKSLKDHPKASVFIFGHSATNEHDTATMSRTIGDALARDRARMLKNKLIFTHGIAPERIRTYDCADRYWVTDNAFTDAHFKALGINTIEAKQRRVIFMASDDVHDLQNFEYTSAEQLYGEYARQCDVFE